MCILQNNKNSSANKVVNSIKFYLNDDLIELQKVGAQDTLLDFLRLERSLTGTKEGCGEGDCGACTVLVGRMDSTEIQYQTVNACICLIPSLNASHVVTVESLRGLNGNLNPVQKAMVNCHGSQCGFCTPGIVMSLYGAWLKSTPPTPRNVEQSLQGNLCRCTGYGPILDAAKCVNEYGVLRADKLLLEKERIKNNLIDLELDQSPIVLHDTSKLFVPNSLETFSELFLTYPDATIVAGATDVGLWITKNLLLIDSIIFIGHLRELKNIKISKEFVEFGSCVTYSQSRPVLSKYFPIIDDYFFRIAGEQIRNVGTIGGNIGNGSPIGDLAPLFIGLNATIVLRKGSVRRKMALENFFLSYKVQDLKKGEFIEKVHIPLNENLYLFVYKISKRRDEDISTVAAVFSFEVFEGKLFNVRVAFGGMAPIPKRALKVEEILNGKNFDIAIVKLAQLAIERDFKPLSDMRASSKYRMQVAKNLIEKCQIEYHTGQSIKLRNEV